MAEHILPFEKRLVELEKELANATDDAERTQLAQALSEEREAVFASITPWQRVMLARHPLRPRMLDFTSRLFEDFIELHGDRTLGDDQAMVCGIARFQGRTVFVAGQQKGVSTDEKVMRNFGMAHPSGYRKALRMFRMAERLGHPIVTFVDTPAAHPGIEAEQTGQGYAIAQNLMQLSGIQAPIFSVVLSEGGSGGALGIAVADHIAMFEHAVYMICPPERCAEILWRDAEKKELAAEALRVTAPDLQQLGVIDAILPEPNGGAHRDPDGAAAALADELANFLTACDANAFSVQRRQERFQRMGVWLEAEA